VLNRALLTGAAVAALAAWPTSVVGQCDTWLPLGGGTSAYTKALATFADQVIVGGEFELAGGVDVNYVAAWDGTNWSDLGGGTNGSVNALCVYNGELVAAGWFSEAGGNVVNGIAAWDGRSWHHIGGGMNSPVGGLYLYEDDLIATGPFTIAGGVPANRIARWNGSVWSAMDQGLDDQGIGLLVVYQGQLYGKEGFNTYKWDGSAWVFCPEIDPFDGQITDMFVYQDKLIVGGHFIGMNGISANGIASWDGTPGGWQSLGDGLGGSFVAVDDMVAYNGDLLVGGSFSTAGGQPAIGIARWDGSQWHALGQSFEGSPGTQAAALIVHGDELVACGNFTVADGQPVNRIARWMDCNLCLADLSGDKEVGIDDLFDVIADWGPCPYVPPLCPGDISPDGGNDVVNVDDLTLLLLHIQFQQDCDPFDACIADVNEDGLIDIDDVFEMLAMWGACPPPPPPPCPADLAPTDTGGDGTVDIDDLFYIIDAWGPCEG
jgi:hypothetical protein